MGISVRSGEAKVVDCGTVTGFMGHPIVLDIQDPVDLVVEFDFYTNEDVEDVAVAVSSFGNQMRLECTNFDKADGRGSAQPVLVGEVGDTLVFLHFRVWLYGRTDDRTLHYTLFSVKKDDVGWTPLAD
ncbi:MAG: hypothetical protein H6737_20395 [Alphaproteobacteria bacterium]|nr:hypothetical protein [Alphaproteobacteria bacterium]